MFIGRRIPTSRRANDDARRYFAFARSCASTLIRPLGSFNFFFQTTNPSFFNAIL